MSSEPVKESILLVRVDDPAAVTIPGSQQFTADCQHLCWITRDSLNLHYDSEVATKTSCLQCAGYEGARDPALLKHVNHVVRAIPGQRETMTHLLGKEATDRVFNMLNIKE